MTPRERLQATLNRKPVDRLCVDFGAGGQTGMGAGAVHRLRQAVLKDKDYRVKVIEPYQMLGEIDDELRAALDLDVVGIFPPMTMFGFRNEGWKPFEMFDGTPVLVPDKFNTTIDEDGCLLIYAEGDTDSPPRGKMPPTSYFFDAVTDRQPFVEENLDPTDNFEEFGLLSDADVQFFVDEAKRITSQTDYGVYLTLPGCAFGDIALVPATWLKRPRGIREVDEWYMSLLGRPDYVLAVFEKQCEYALQNIERLAEALGDMVDVAFLSGTDYGTQQSLFMSQKTYRDLFKPFASRLNRLIHEKTSWKTFIHSCGAVFDLIEDFIDAGFDVLNPVQCSACGMDPKRLKKEFGDSIVFWGGGVDTQKTLPFGTPDDVYREVRERIEILGDGGGFVFNSTHNVQSNIPTENMLAMFRAVEDSRNL